MAHGPARMPLTFDRDRIDARNLLGSAGYSSAGGRIQALELHLDVARRVEGELPRLERGTGCHRRLA